MRFRYFVIERKKSHPLGRVLVVLNLFGELTMLFFSGRLCEAHKVTLRATPTS